MIVGHVIKVLLFVKMYSRNSSGSWSPNYSYKSTIAVITGGVVVVHAVVIVLEVVVHV